MCSLFDLVLVERRVIQALQVPEPRGREGALLVPVQERERLLAPAPQSLHVCVLAIYSSQFPACVPFGTDLEKCSLKTVPRSHRVRVRALVGVPTVSTARLETTLSHNTENPKSSTLDAVSPTCRDACPRARAAAPPRTRPSTPATSSTRDREGSLVVASPAPAGRVLKGDFFATSRARGRETERARGRETESHSLRADAFQTRARILECVCVSPNETRSFASL